MITWPMRASAAIRKLFEPLQDIDVYIEDTNDEPFYRALLNRATSCRIPIARVIALGGREKVIEAATAHDHSARRALFIIDGDLDYVCGNQPPIVIGLHQHDAYCIENLLICESAIVKILSQEIVSTDDVARQRLRYDEFIEHIQIPLIELFSSFAVSRLFTPSTTTVKTDIGTLCSQDQSGKTILDHAKVESFKNYILHVAEQVVGSEPTNNTYNDMLKRIRSLSPPLKAVSGKDFLLPLLDFWIRQHGCRIRRKTLRMRLAEYIELNILEPLSSALSKAARGFST